MRPSIVRVMAALIGAVVLLSVPATARADDPEWIRLGCFSGAIDRVSAFRGLFEVDGHVDCANPEIRNAEFMYALYREKQAVAFGSTAIGYRPDGPTTNSIQKDLPAGDFAICLVTDYTVRVACDMVNPGRGGTVIATPLPTDDPLVNREVELYGYGAGSDPVCGTCW